MNERDVLYGFVRQAQENRKRRNFDAFMNGLEGGLIKDLDETYNSGNADEYNELVRNIKARGIKVLRNSDGKHKLKYL